MKKRTPQPNPLEVLRKQEREVDTTELWGGNQFSELFPTLTDSEVFQVRENIQHESDDRYYHHTDN